MKEACAYIETIRNLKSFIRLRELKSIIEEKTDYYRLYSEYRTLKQESVKMSVYGRDNPFHDQMEDKMSLILSDPIVSEYVALLADLNESIQAVQDYINNALDIDK